MLLMHYQKTRGHCLQDYNANGHSGTVQLAPVNINQLLEPSKVQFQRSLRGDQGQGLHKVWLTGLLWDWLCLLTRLISSGLSL